LSNSDVIGFELSESLSSNPISLLLDPAYISSPGYAKGVKHFPGVYKSLNFSKTSFLRPFMTEEAEMDR